MKTSLVYPYGKPLLRGRLKETAEDFRVEEVLGFEPAGAGEHLFIQVEKTNLTTHTLIERIARNVGIKPRDVGYSGLKDKTAVTSQWLSLHLPGKKHVPVSLDSEEYVILRQAWHDRKLRPGTHRCNRFDVIIRDVDEPGSNTLEQIEAIRNFGMANYFGHQRFGVMNDNVERALRDFASISRSRRLSRNKRSLYLSALRSDLFNQVLSRRIAQGIWRQPLEGDVFMLSGSQSIFQDLLSEEIMQRYRNFDISSTASLYGDGAVKLQGAALAIEQQVHLDNETLCQCLLSQGAKRQMRVLRHRAKDLSLDYQAHRKQLRIRVTLPRGSYFTSLLAHFIDTNS